MKKYFILFFLSFLLISLFSGTVNAEIAAVHPNDQVCIVYFFSETCPHCRNLRPFIAEMEQKYEGKIALTKYDVSNPENIAVYNKFCISKNYTQKGIPILGVNDRLLIGEDEIRQNLEDEIIRGVYMENKICPLEGMECHINNQSENNTGTNPLIPQVGEKLNFLAVLPVVLFTGLADGVNPCAFAVLIFIMAFLQQIAGNRKRLLKVTVSYIVAVLLVNICLGIFYFYTSIQIGFPQVIRYIAIALAIVAGLINIKDFFWYGKGFSLEIPKRSKKYIESLATKATVSAALILGVLVALLEAPCSVPIYLTILEVLKSHGSAILGVMPYILLYNLMFILPLVILATMIYIGASAKGLEKWRESNRRYMKLAIGLILIGLALAMLFGLI